MEKARLYQDGTVGEKVFAHEIVAHEIDDEPWWRRQKIPLICAFCMTPVVSQRTTVGRAPRAALFRLAQDRQHEDACPLNPTGVLQKITHGSQGVAVIKGDELHLVLPDDLGQIGATTPVIDTGPAAPGDRFGVNISTVRPLLPPLINSAVVIARFLQKHDYDADVVAQFKVRRPSETKGSCSQNGGVPSGSPSMEWRVRPGSVIALAKTETSSRWCVVPRCWSATLTIFSPYALGGWCFSSRIPDCETMFDSKSGSSPQNHLYHYLRFSRLTPAT